MVCFGQPNGREDLKMKAADLHDRPALRLLTHCRRFIALAI